MESSGASSSAPPAAKPEKEDADFEYTKEVDDEGTLEEEEAQDQGNVQVCAAVSAILPAQVPVWTT